MEDVLEEVEQDDVDIVSTTTCTVEWDRIRETHQLAETTYRASAFAS